MKETPTIFTDFLKALGVPHTYGYSAARFAAMPFQSLFGMKKLLGEYGVDSDGYQLPEGADMLGLTPPYIAKSPGGLVIVTGYSPDRTRVEYLSQGVAESIDADEFRRVMPGTVFMAFPGKDSREPDYSLHRRDLFFKTAKRLGLLMCITLIFLYLFISSGIYSHWSTVALTVLNICGLYFSTLLMQKSLKIHNPAADRVCKVLQEGGCDSVLETKASTFFGIFSWSEVGFTYFSVSLLCLLIYPQYTGYLALCNLCCLPFSFWSVWYQKTRAKAWCTLCLSVQTTLWLLFFCYLGGGWLRHMFPIRIEFVILVLTYGAVLLGLNRLSPLLNNTEKQ